MRTDRLSDLVVGAAGNVAGAVVDPRQGFNMLRSAVSSRTVVTVAAGLVVGFLLARATRRA
ncbi:hypothetical protein [Micromonospora eburnea]|uniref:Uncharacterized protein n=1 Tax=Micromonospora eburnea TaxID=227316 RepID=A0A1C6UL61_9ACTN|nr:hypothetical protein [Micromonospora eburnea]SCL54796.1 hypothetical protein GA0070604_3073 [Micromonospora eburnea]